MTSFENCLDQSRIWDLMSLGLGLGPVLRVGGRFWTEYQDDSLQSSRKHPAAQHAAIASWEPAVEWCLQLELGIEPAMNH